MGSEKANPPPPHGTVEQLLQAVAAIPSHSASFGLWVPEKLVLDGNPVSLDAALAMVNNAALAKEFEVREFHQSPAGWFYIFDR